MDYLRTLVAAGLLAAGSSHAFVFPSPPPGFGGSPGNWTFAVPSGTEQIGKIAYQSKALSIPVPGSAATMPAAYRFAANAPRIAAAAIFLNPYVRAGVGIATWLGVGAIVWDAVNNRWTVPSIDGELSDGKVYRIPQWYTPESQTPWESTMDEACSAGIARLNALAGISFYMAVCRVGEPSIVRRSDGLGSDTLIWIESKGSDCPAGWYVTPAGCVQTPPPKVLTQPEFVEKLAPIPMPDTVPWELPKPTPLPVDQPWINPAPGENPQHRPLFVPTGDPVPNPNYDPNAAPGPANEPWHQPGIRLTPSPTLHEPWRIDTQPVNRPQAGPEPLPEHPNDPDNPDKPKPEEEQSLCEKHPDIVACQKLGSLNADPLPKNTVPLSINREEGFGPSAGVCPAPKQFVIMGKQMAFRWDLLCDFASQIKPLLVGFAYLSAALAFLGLSRKD